MKIQDLIVESVLDNQFDSRGNSIKQYETRDRIYLEDYDDDIKNCTGNEQFTYNTDYAALCGAATLSYGDYLTDNNITRPQVACKIATRTSAENNKSIVNLWSEKILNLQNLKNMDIERHTNYKDLSYRPAMKLALQRFLQLRNYNPSLLPITPVSNSFISNAFDLTIGEYPQTYVGNEMNVILEQSFENASPELVETGRAYPSEFGNPYNKEYIFNGKKYVRTHAYTSYMHPKLSDGQEPKPYADYWIAVEPIQWRITNWDNLPQSINPKGNGTAKTINLRTEDAIISGIPFYNEKSHSNSNLWQNSFPRAFLNGYNLEKTIKKDHNGNTSAMAQYNYDCSGKNNFMSLAFGDMELTKDLTPAEEIIQHSRRKRESRYGITIPNKPMSIDDQIRYYIDNRRPFMLHGKSGIGKSRRIADINPNFVSLTLRNGILPEEVIGKDTTDENGVSKWTPPSFYVELVKRCEENPDTNIVLFIDELTNVNEHEQSIVYDIVLNHSVKPNCGKLPDNCVVVAAGNSKEESDSAYNMPEPLFRRFHGHVYLPLDLESLLEWGTELRKDNPEQTNLHPLISSYLSTYEDALYSNYDPEKTGKNYALDPRCWEQVSDLIYDNKGELWEELLANKIGEENASRLLAFAERNFITIEDILEDNYDYEDIPTKLDEQYALALTLRHASEQEISKVREFVARHLSGETLAKFDYVWTNNNPERAMIIGQLQVEQEDIKKVDHSSEILTTGSDKRIHIREFCGDAKDWIKNNPDKVIKCDNPEQAEILCKAFGLLGLTWHDGSEYIDSNGTINYGKRSYSIDNWCLYSNDGLLSSLPYMIKKSNVDIFKFYEVDFSGVLPPRDIKYIEDMQYIGQIF